MRVHLLTPTPAPPSHPSPRPHKRTRPYSPTHNRTRNEMSEEAEAMGRQLQQTPQHAPSENHLTLQRASEIVRPSTTQSHPQPPHSATQAEMPTPQSIPADNPETGRDQLLRDENVRLETSMPVVQCRPAQAALQLRMKMSSSLLPLLPHNDALMMPP